MLYTTTLPGNGHWSLEMRRGSLMKITDLEGGANVGMLFYNYKIVVVLILLFKKAANGGMAERSKAPDLRAIASSSLL